LNRDRQSTGTLCVLLGVGMSERRRASGKAFRRSPSERENVLNVFDIEFNEDSFLNVDARVGMFILDKSWVLPDIEKA
jgi:hypothetical protein